MDIQSLVGKTVRITLGAVDLQDRYFHPRIRTDEQTVKVVAQIDSIDQLGLWVKINEYPIYNNVTRQREEAPALVLIRFEYITSIVHFPDIEENSNKAHRIGFVAQDEY